MTDRAEFELARLRAKHIKFRKATADLIRELVEENRRLKEQLITKETA